MGIAKSAGLLILILIANLFGSRHVPFWPFSSASYFHKLIQSEYVYRIGHIGYDNGADCIDSRRKNE